MSSDPAYIGPGYWTAWHRKTLYTDTKQKKSEAARNIAVDISLFPCMNCRNHARGYVQKNPLIPAVESNDPLSLFKWTVKFHNFVNARLNKPLINIEKALQLWSGDNVCVGNCGMEEEKEDVKEEKSENKNDIIIKNY